MFWNFNILWLSVIFSFSQAWHCSIFFPSSFFNLGTRVCFNSEIFYYFFLYILLSLCLLYLSFYSLTVAFWIILHNLSFIFSINPYFLLSWKPLFKLSYFLILKELLVILVILFIASILNYKLSFFSFWGYFIIKINIYTKCFKCSACVYGQWVWTCLADKHFSCWHL